MGRKTLTLQQVIGYFGEFKKPLLQTEAFVQRLQNNELVTALNVKVDKTCSLSTKRNACRFRFRADVIVESRNNEATQPQA